MQIKLLQKQRVQKGYFRLGEGLAFLSVRNMFVMKTMIVLAAVEERGGPGAEEVGVENGGGN